MQVLDQRKIGYRVIWLASVMAVCSATIVLAQQPANPNPVTLRWTAPMSGSPVVRYAVEIRDVDSDEVWTFEINPAPGSAQSFEFTELHFLRVYEGRVAGIDALNRQGVWSTWSDTYCTEAAQPNP